MMTPPTLFGRDRELSLWSGVRDRLDNGQGGVLAFSGRPGLGKTALVQTALHDAGDAGWQALRAANDQVAQNLPGNVLWQLFARPVRQGGAGEAPFDGPGELLHGFVHRQEQDVEASALGFATAWVLRSLAEDGPLVVAVDDVQWSDDLSLDALAAAINLVGDEPVLFVLGARTDPAEPSNPKVDALLARSGTEHAALSPLRHRDIADWLAAETELRNRDTVSQVQIASGGVPYFVNDLLASIPGPSGEVDDGDGWGEHRSAQEMLSTRIESLAPEDSEILRAITFLGDHAVDEYIVGLTGHDADALTRSFESLRSQRLIAPDLPLRVTHSLVGGAVRSSTGPEASSATNRRIALLLEGADRDAAAAFLLETSPSDSPEDARILLTAGRTALGLGAAEIAFRFFDRAMKESSIDPDLKAELLIGCGHALLKAGRTDEAGSRWQEAMKMGLDPGHRIECLLGIGDAEYAVGRLAEATGSFTDALAVAESAGEAALPPGAKSRIVTRIASTGVLSESGLSSPGEHIAAVVAADPAGDTIDDRTLLVQEALRLTLVGAPADQAGPLARRALAGTALLDEISVEGPILAMAIASLVYSERDAESMRILDQAMAHARRRGSVLGYATLCSCRGFLHFFRGRLRLAQADHEAALAAAEVGLNPYFDASVDQLCQIHVARSDPEAAGALLELAPLDEGLPDVILALRNHVHGLVLDLGGDREGALAHFSAANEYTEGYGGQMLKAWDRSAVDTALALGRDVYAASLAERLLTQARQVGAPRFLGFALRTRAHTQDFAPAVASLREAIGLLTAGEGRYELALALTDLAELLRENAEGDPERLREADDLSLRAAGIAERIGAKALLLRLAPSLAESPAGSTGGSGSKADRLSVAELKVCQLALRGLTNRQIAEHLFITVKGVEWHLSRSYRKLGITSRRDLGSHLDPAEELTG